MPRTIDEGFRDFLAALTPSPTETAAAASHRNSISVRLDSTFGLRRFTRIGSFGNGTSVYGYSDVDYLACLNRSSLTNDSAYTLRKVRTDLEARFPNTDVHVDSPVVVVPFGRLPAEWTEVVVADEVGAVGSYLTYDIANGAGGWMKINPDAHNAYVRKIDDGLAGKVKPLIRFVKAWKYLQSAPISSFYLELRVAKYAETETSIVYSIDVMRILRMLLNGNLAQMQDPTGVSGYVSPCKSQAEFDNAYSRLQTAVTRAEKADACRVADDVSGAFDWWRLLYGDAFPTCYR